MIFFVWLINNMTIINFKSTLLTNRFASSNNTIYCFPRNKETKEKVYFRSQILERPSIGEYWNISGVPVLPENMIFTFFRTCWCYSEAYNTGTQKWWSSIVQYSCTSIWDLKYTFSETNKQTKLLQKRDHYMHKRIIDKYKSRSKAKQTDLFFFFFFFLINNGNKVQVVMKLNGKSD